MLSLACAVVRFAALEWFARRTLPWFVKPAQFARLALLWMRCPPRSLLRWWWPLWMATATLGHKCRVTTLSSLAPLGSSV